MSALIRQSHANNESPLWLSVEGTNVVDGTLTINGDIVTNGSQNSAGLIMKNSQHISILDGGIPTQNESLRITAGTTGAPYPDGAFANFGTGLDGAFGFGVIGQQPSTTLIAGGIGNNADVLLVGGLVSSQGVQTTQLSLVNQDPAKAVYGTATLVAGSAVINTTQCAGPSTIILLTRTNVNASTTLGELRIRSRNVGNFTIESDVIAAPGIAEAGDLSDVDWVIINPNPNA